MKYLLNNIKKYFRLFKLTKNVSGPVMILAAMLAGRVSEDFLTSMVCVLIAVVIITVCHVVKCHGEFKNLGDKLFYVVFISMIHYALFYYPFKKLSQANWYAFFDMLEGRG